MEVWLFTHPLWIIHVPNSLEHFSLYEFTSTHKKFVSVEPTFIQKAPPSMGFPLSKGSNP
jgi:hypothetical protein